MKVEIWSDVVCPFCYIGKRNFEAALLQFTDKNDIEIEWKSFQLDPTTPKVSEPVDYVQYLSDKKGWSSEQTRQMLAQVTQTAKNAGLDCNLENTKRVNTFDLHRIIQMAKTKGLGDRAEELFFKAYFTDTLDLGSAEIVQMIAGEIGLSANDVELALTDNSFAEKVNDEIKEANAIGVNGVPFFVFDRKYAISGAQPVDAFLQTLTQAHSEWKGANPDLKMQVQEGPSCDINGNCD